MPRRLLEVEDALAQVDAYEGGAPLSNIAGCEVQLWRPTEPDNPYADWVPVRVRALQVRAYLHKGFRKAAPSG